MLIELIGCTSAGKSTLAKKIVQDCHERGIGISMGDDHVLRLLRMNRVENRVLRTLLLDLVAYTGCLIGCWKYRQLYAYITRTILKLPRNVPFFQRLNIARNAFKKIGISELIRRTVRDAQIVMMDEGAVHTVHYLFVHVSIEPRPDDLLAFLELVPLPDVAVYLQQDETALIQRVRRRGHGRIRNATHSKVERFVQHAVYTFEYLVKHPRLRERLLVVNSQKTVVVPQEHLTAPAAIVLDILDRVLRFQQQGLEN